MQQQTSTCTRQKSGKILAQNIAYNGMNLILFLKPTVSCLKISKSNQYSKNEDIRTSGTES